LSRLKIFPPVVTLYPNDRQKFTAVAVPQPAMWFGVASSGDIANDFSLHVDAVQSSVAGNGAHKLYSGIGHIEWKIDDNFRPTSSGSFNMTAAILDSIGFLYLYRVTVNTTNIVIQDEALVTLDTISYSVVSGDVFKIELANGFRLYRNGTLLNSRVSLPTQTVYPMSYSANVIEPHAAAPSRILPPKLVGDWRLSETVTFTAPSHGTISTTGPSLETTYSGGTVPGTYILTGQIEPSSDAEGVQKTTAVVSIPPLETLGPRKVVLQPAEKRRFKANYDDAQAGNLVAWSVSAGRGSFTQSEFTADTFPGTSIVRATAAVNSNIAEIMVTVPAVITNASGYTAAKASEQIDFDTNIPALPFFVAAGTMAEGVGNVIPGLPAALQEKDIMLLFVETANQTVSAPSGWVATADSPQGTGTAGDVAATSLSVFWKRATAVESAPTVTDPGDHAIAQILSFRGCIDTGDPWDVTSGNTAASSTSVSIPGDTTTVANCLVVLAVSNGTDSATAQTSGYANTDLANLTERTDVNSTQGNGGGFAVATGEKATAGAYGATTATLANASTQGRISIALKPSTTAWTASIGSINSSSGIWTAPSLTGQTAKIAATNGPNIVILEIDVLEVFPLKLSAPLKWDRRKTVLSSRAEDRSRPTRVKDKDGKPFEAWENSIGNLEVSELETLHDFWDRHHPGVPFIFEDGLRGLRKVVYSDSDLSHQAESDCSIGVSFRWIEV